MKTFVNSKPCISKEQCDDKLRVKKSNLKLQMSFDDMAKCLSVQLYNPSS